MPKDLYAGAYLGSVATVEDLKRMYGDDGLKGLSKPNPRIELTQIAARLTERAEKIAKEQSVIFPEAYKRASREDPEAARRYQRLMNESRGFHSDD